MKNFYVNIDSDVQFISTTLELQKKMMMNPSSGLLGAIDTIISNCNLHYLCYASDMIKNKVVSLYKAELRKLYWDTEDVSRRRHYVNGCVENIYKNITITLSSGIVIESDRWDNISGINVKDFIPFKNHTGEYLFRHKNIKSLIIEKVEIEFVDLL